MTRRGRARRLPRASPHLVDVGVQTDGGTVLHEVSPGVHVEVERVVHQKQPVRGLLPDDVVALPVKVLTMKTENVEL